MCAVQAPSDHPSKLSKFGFNCSKEVLNNTASYRDTERLGMLVTIDTEPISSAKTWPSLPETMAFP